MTLRDALIAGRSQIAILLGLLTTGLIVFLTSDMGTPQLRRLVGDARMEGVVFRPTEQIPVRGVAGELTAEEREMAEIAWRYFAENTRKETGLVDSVSGYPFTTLWDTATYLLALIAAERLLLISPEDFHGRMDAALVSLSRLTLYEGELPNKSYNVKTLRMVDYSNKESDTGIGWSAIDIGRLFVPLNVLVYGYPDFIPRVKAIVGSWRYDRMFQEGLLYGTGHTGFREEFHQEGRLGYEEYVAKSFALLGFDVSQASRYLDWTALVEIEDVAVPVDVRLPEFYGAHAYQLSEPYILDGLEFGWDYYSREFAWRVFRAQEERYGRTGHLTAVTETALDGPPYFVYNAVYADGIPWACMTDKGEVDALWRTLSTKAAMGWSVLFDAPYARRLGAAVEGLAEADKGFYSGRYESDGRINDIFTCNTNGVILEALHYRVFGPYLAATTGRFGDMRSEKPEPPAMEPPPDIPEEGAG